MLARFRRFQKRPKDSSLRLLQTGRIARLALGFERLAGAGLHPSHGALGMRRREFIGLLGGAAAWPLTVQAQQPVSVRRLGYLSPGRPVPHLYASFIEALGQLGWHDGRNIVLEFRYGENDADRLARMAAELTNLKVDVIVAAGTLGPLAAKRATTIIPSSCRQPAIPWEAGLLPVWPSPAATSPE
jgi:hypothetical protein